MTSYRRKCKYCGRWISIRQMPAGQWVAFEGYDTPHDCETEIRLSHSKKVIEIYSNKEHEKQLPYESLDFPEVDISTVGSFQTKANQKLIEVTNFESQSESKNKSQLSSESEKKKQQIPTWLWLLGLAILLLWLLFKWAH